MQVPSAIGRSLVDVFVTYTHPYFQRHIDAEKVSCIYEVGSCDGFEAILLRNHFQAPVYAFECNPAALRLAKEMLAREPGITLIPYGAWDENCELEFYPVVATLDEGREIAPNIGASSFFKARDDYRQSYTQEATTVEVVRLEDHCLQHQVPPCDLLCMDVQGSALRALKGMGRLLDHVRYIISELERVPIYLGQDLFGQADEFLRDRGFEPVAELERDAWFSDFLYRRKGEQDPSLET